MELSRKEHRKLRDSLRHFVVAYSIVFGRQKVSTELAAITAQWKPKPKPERSRK